MTVDLCYRILQYAVNKAQDGNLTPSEFNDVFNIAQKGYESYLLGQLNQYQPNHPQSRVQYSQNEISRQKLTPLIYGYNLTIDSTGFSPYPGDFSQVDAMWSTYGYNRIRWAKQEKLNAYINSVIEPIASNPIYLIEDRGFRFFPITTATAKLSYVRNVPDVVWGYTTDANGRPVYSAARSTQPVWNDVDIFEVLVRALQLIGVNLQIGVVMQYAEKIKKEGQ